MTTDAATKTRETPQDQAKASLNAYLEPFSSSDPQINALCPWEDMPDEAAVWLTVGNWQMGPTSLGVIRRVAEALQGALTPPVTQTARGSADPQPDHKR